MLKTGQNISQKQSQQQKLSPQQIQFVKLLQLPTIGLEQRIKEEIEMNPVLEEADPVMEESIQENELNWEKEDETGKETEDSPEIDPVDKNDSIDWDSFMHNTEYDGTGYSGFSGSSGGDEDWRDLPNPYHQTLLEELEHQVSLLDLDDEEMLIADQILGSLDKDGYFRREIEAVIDNIAFNQGTLVSAAQVEKVRKMIQRLDPVGIASRDLRDCLLVQLKTSDIESEIRSLAIEMLEDYWESFEKKHFSKLKSRLDIDDEQLREIFELIKGLNPKPGGVANPDEDNRQYIEPDFEVYFEPSNKDDESGEGEFVIKLSQRNTPPLRISPEYKMMWDNLKKKNQKDKEEKQARNFIKDKIESAQWFIDSILQRQNTLMKTMRTIVSLQEDFFKHGDGLKPMILKDVADRIKMDISTVSRVVNGKYVQTNFGVYELKYFFSEGLETESGEDVSSREVKNVLQEIIDNEDKKKPYSDQALTNLLKEKGYKVARRTVSKYREQLQLPVARLRKQII
ncbi:RNA polymerase factor sigma-54 [Rhodohalobacter barkolensis]|uniref:RNA polymerase sigma-54 factor n=1 Tax=Rhodohalobacter barkolensis TaxID=2053187 RepID=A0A2N0VFD7_9BACT|nr:RNA polymerase factor sigma-54 [Rhodohalobacter barkolensis]PKD42903.1 RNA polymerase sigma-54 factor [Rhodohalobacter barkolensis]